MALENRRPMLTKVDVHTAPTVLHEQDINATEDQPSASGQENPPENSEAVTQQVQILELSDSIGDPASGVETLKENQLEEDPNNLPLSEVRILKFYLSTVLANINICRRP
jgi:hypothetical protein